jgi:large subunit ribosomal protein L4
MDIPVYNLNGEQTGSIAVDEAAFGGKPNRDLLRQALIAHEANCRVGTARAKRIDEVSGSGAKAWRQKGTGRARQGDRRGPHWVGGSKAHGPRQRNYRQKLNRAMRRQALRSAFLAKALDGEVLVVENFDLPELKTRAMATVLKNLHVERSFLVVTEEHKPELWRCTRNIPGAGMSVSNQLFAYQVIRPQRLVFTRQALENFVNMAGKQGAESNG